MLGNDGYQTINDVDGDNYDDDGYLHPDDDGTGYLTIGNNDDYHTIDDDDGGYLHPGDKHIGANDDRPQHTLDDDREKVAQVKDPRPDEARSPDV